MPIFSTVKRDSFFSVAVGVISAGITGKGSKRDVVDLGAGLLGSWKKLPSVGNGILDAIVVGEEERCKILVVVWTINENL